METPFFGPSYVSKSTNLADQRLINLYPEVVETKTGKAIGMLTLCPGLTLRVNLDHGPILSRSMMVMAGLLYVISGTTLYRVSPTFTPTEIGTISLTSNVSAYVYSTVTGLVPIALPFTAPSDGNIYLINNGAQLLISIGAPTAYQDGFGLMVQPNSNIWWQSNLLDLTTWDALNFASASGDSDNIVGIIQLKLEVFLVKQYETEVWVNVGTPGFAFQRVSGIYVEQGAVTGATISRIGEKFMFLGQSTQGNNVVIEMNSYTPRRVSTHAIEEEISGYSTTTDAFSYTYQQEGHVFYVLVFPSGNTVWVYDATSSDLLGIPCWHQRAAFANGAFSRHWGNSYVFFAGLHLVGDYTNGNVYSYDTAVLTDNGTTRKWLRSWNALPKMPEDVTRFAALWIDMQTGLGIDPSTDPQVVLRFSDDGGHNWSNEFIRSAGKLGQTARRVKFNRLGSTRKSTGLNRIFELSSTDIMPVNMFGAYLR